MKQDPKVAESSLKDASPDISRLKAWAPHLSEEQLGMCAKYISELLRFNKSLNLVSHSSALKIDAAHILDVVRAWALIGPKVPKGSTFHDFGSGNGLPGLLCAGLSPDHHFHVVDRDERKMEFCKHVVSTLKLKNVTVSCIDVATLGRGSVSYALSRGFASVTKSLLLSRPLLKVGGVFFMMKGESWSIELGDLPPQMFGIWKSEMIGQYSLPETPAEFVVLQCTKIQE